MPHCRLTSQGERVMHSASLSHSNGHLSDWFAQLKDNIDLHDLADKLGMKRHGQRGNYHSPHHKDKAASVSVFAAGRAWKDHSGDEGGSCIDLVRYCRQDIATPLDAARLLGDWYGMPMPKPEHRASATPKSRAELIAERSVAAAEGVLPYLQERGISEDVIRQAIKCKTLGWNTWTSNSIPAGQVGHAGPAATFIVRQGMPSKVLAVDMRYQDPTLNGGVKTTCQGERDGHGWTSDPQRLARAHTVYIVESPINALSVECCQLGGSFAALALRGTGNADKIDWAFLKGKRVVIALDHADPVNPRTEHRPGLAAAWRLAEALAAADIGFMLVDMLEWKEGEDINDVLQQHGADELNHRLRKLEPWLIPGMPGCDRIEELPKLEGRRRVFLPGHDLAVYWRFRCKEDFTQYVDEFKDNDEGQRSVTLGDLCSFRVVSLARLRVQGHLATINGIPDSQCQTYFGISAQTARHGANLVRHVADEDKLHNLEWWGARFGAIWKPAQFKRMVNILERTADIGARDVVNFVGLAWRQGELAAMEGKDCFFVEPQKQCLYHNMSFPRGMPQQAASVIAAFQATFKQNAASIALVWALGAHIKNVLGFYPHYQMQAEKGAGKSKLLESLQSALAFQVLSGQNLKTDHRRRMSVSYTSHPVGWDEFSKLPKNVLGDIDGLLQDTYRSSMAIVGANAVQYLMCAPVLLAGEEVDVVSLQSKICRGSLQVAKQGPIIPRDLPQFPVWPWLQFLARTPAARIRDVHQQWQAYCTQHSRCGDSDPTAARMLENYAAILAAWALLCEFAGIDIEQGGFVQDLIAEMNAHIAETDGTRLPWVWIMEILLSEIEAGRFEHPYRWDTFRHEDGSKEIALFLRPNHVMDHLSTASHLRAKFDSLPVKTGRVFKDQLMKSGVALADEVEKTIRCQRARHLTAISLSRLEKLGLYATPNLGQN